MVTFWQNFVESGYIWFMLAAAAFLILPSVWKDWKRSRLPEFEARAMLVSRKLGSDRSGKNVYETYLGTFETDAGQIVELEMTRQLYYTLKEGVWGQLYWKGKALEDFREERTRT